MKKKLLYLTSILLFSAASINAQRVWDFGNNTTLWPVNPTEFTTTTVVDGLTEVGGTGFGIVNARPLSWADTYVSTNEFRSGGSSAGNSGAKPTTRYFSFPVTGPTTVVVYFRVNGTGGRTLKISDGTTVLSGTGSNTSENAEEPLKWTVNYTGGAGTIYVYSTASINYFKIVSLDGSLDTDSFQAESSVAVYANEGAINVSNVTSATKVSVYSVLGSLVKSIETAADTSLSIGSGLYIVKAQSAEGTKTAKVLVK